jgi:predicted RNA-binding Zn ribbon-like protein
MDEVRTNAATLKLLGGRLSLDFANTADWHASDHPVEFLTSYSDLVAWSQHVGILTDQKAQRLLKEAAHRPEDATAVLERAIALREAIYRIFSAISHGRPPQAADLATFNAELSGALAQSRIVSTLRRPFDPSTGSFDFAQDKLRAGSAQDKAQDTAVGGFAWDWAGAEDALDQMLWPVVHDAAGLLTSEELDRVGQCDDDRCGWLFLDTSRNRSRRWCSMEDCGNRAKARRYYERKRAVRKRET